MTFAQELERDKRLDGILPIEDVLLYGSRSLLVITHFPMERSTGPVNIRKALERLTSAYDALSSVHSRGITINVWPHIGFQTHDASFIWSYAFDPDDKTVADWPVPGAGAVSHKSAHAPIVGRPFPRRILPGFPPPPVEGGLAFVSEESRPRPWTPNKAAVHPLVPGPRLVSRCLLLGRHLRR